MPATDSSATALLAELRAGRLEPEAHLDDVERLFERHEAELHAFVPEAGRFDRLRAEAGDLRSRHPDPDRRPPLFGLVVGVKDVFHVDGFETRAGSRLPPAELAGPQAAVVTELKRQGALIAGKTVSTEFAYFAPGPTRNPRALEHTPGGSSSGSAAAVAAGFCPLALGTQTYGSVARPAAYCGVVGLKPTYDRISRAGVIPLAPSLDHVGTFTGDVAGARLVAPLLCGDWRAERPSRRPVLAVPLGPYLARASPEALRHLERVRDVLESRGYRIREIRTLSGLDGILARHDLIVAAEAAQVHSDWYARYGRLYHERLRELIENGLRVPARDLGVARRGREELRDELTALMDRHGIDLWIAPGATGPAPEGLESTGDPVMSTPWTHAGLPTLTIPAGTDERGLPLGLQIVGRWHRDEELLAWGEAIEKAVQE